jgi:hypothetical protein
LEGGATIAENDATDRQLMAMFDWTTPRLVPSHSHGACGTSIPGV